jgi:transposase
MRWSEMWMDGGTTIMRFHTFIERILDDLDQRFPNRSFVFTMDNLSSHKNPLILNAILNAGHRYVFRAPYWPVDGAVEYVFNAIQTQLRIYFNRINDMADLRNRINLIVGGFQSFARFFIHVGFPV